MKKQEERVGGGERGEAHRIGLRLRGQLLPLPHVAAQSRRVLLETNVPECASDPEDAVEPIARDIA